MNTEIEYGLFARHATVSAFQISNESMVSGPVLTRAGSQLEDFQVGLRQLAAVAADVGAIIGFDDHAALLRSLYGQQLLMEVCGGSRRRSLTLTRTVAS